MHRLVVCLAFVFLAQIRTLAQPRQINGQVLTETNRQPIESAYITVCHLPDSLVIAFARSQATGSFSVRFTPEVGQTYFLKASHISYRDAFLELPPPGVPVEFRLVLGQHTLNEVQITARVPVQEQGDSTRYRVDSFARGEQTLEDVLKKMPNVRVEDNGDIYFIENSVKV